MLIYRIEHAKTGAGPYEAGELLSDFEFEEWCELAVFSRFSGGPTKHPSPAMDGFEHVRDEEYFGFGSPEQLAAWFGESFVAEAAEAGFVVSVYDVPARFVRKGGRQILFEKSRARLVGQFRSFEELTNSSAVGMVEA